LTREAFDDQVLATIVSLRAPFRAVEDPEWRKLALLQNSRFPLPSSTTIRNRLKAQMTHFEETALSQLVDGSKVAISLDCWSSSTRLCFMSIIAHYITKDWELIEELIGFESLKQVHSGKELAKIVNKVIATFDLTGRVISITTDNASNNGTMLDSINSYLEEAFDNDRFLGGKIQHIPCLAHVIQLALKELLGKLRLRPTNESLILEWEEQQELDELELMRRAEDRGIPYILAKV
jgi:hypothetical protein